MVSKREREQIEADAAWWNRLADTFGWRLYGFSWRHHATFFTNLPEGDTIQINGHQCSQMMATVECAKEGLIK